MVIDVPSQIRLIDKTGRIVLQGQVSSPQHILRDSRDFKRRQTLLEHRGQSLVKERTRGAASGTARRHVDGNAGFVKPSVGIPQIIRVKIGSANSGSTRNIAPNVV